MDLEERMKHLEEHIEKQTNQNTLFHLKNIYRHILKDDIEKQYVFGLINRRVEYLNSTMPQY